MHPAFSVIFFTVASGAGLGLFALLAITDAAGLGGLSGQPLILAGLTALGLTAAGLVSSTFHLANPKNAWRAFSRFRTSWLSREGVFAVAFFPFALAYLLVAYLGWPEWLRAGLGAIAAVLALITVYCTGMIYACLRTIRVWNTPMVPIGYLTLGLYSGALLLLAFVAAGGKSALAPYFYLVVGLLLGGALLKGVYYYWLGAQSSPFTINAATGFTHAQVKLLDQGHTHGTFLTSEFGYRANPRNVYALKLFVMLQAFVLPLVALLVGGRTWAPWVASAIALTGLVAERWLFFAEARHVVNLYHGTQRV